MIRTHRAPRFVSAIVLVLAALLPAGAGRADDSDLFTTTAVAPNVLLLLDSSSTMNHLIWHPMFDPSAALSCNSATYGSFPTVLSGAFDPNATYYGVGSKLYYRNALGNLVSLGNNSLTRTNCGKTHTIPTDPNASPDPTLDPNTKYTHYSGAYLNWLFSTASDPYWGAGATPSLRIDSGSNGSPSSCVGGASFGKYQRTRMNVVKQVVKDIVCLVNLVGQVRFGIAQFRLRANGTTDTNGGYVIEEVEIPNSNQQADLVSAINSVDAETDAPLAEALFQLYTYFMSRTSADLPVGLDGVTQFPRYEYNTSSSGTGGNWVNNSSSWAIDPVQYSCQKHFIMIITDGDSTKDDFDVENDVAESAGFANFNALIGDYNADGETELQPNLGYTGSEATYYLDDVAKYMTEKDFRPDFSGDQTIDTYTIGFHTSFSANQLLSKTAAAGNGTFFAVNDETALAQAIIDQLTSIIEKSQSFTAATVPASRTESGDHIYVSLFTPTSKTGYWDGNLRAYEFTGSGEILDANGNCAIDDPACDSGVLLDTVTAPPFWDAGDQIPAPDSRVLYASRLNGANEEMTDFRHTSDTPPGVLTAADLGVVYPPASTYSGSVATDAEELTAEIIANVRGCEFGTGANGVACVTRSPLLNDIFHSNPVVVGSPNQSSTETTYQAFKTAQEQRTKMIYAGSNGGFLHGFNAGDWDSLAGKHDHGTGVELFGFMPWPARKNIQYKPIDNGNRDYYYVDGSPQAADVWFYDATTPDQVGPASVNDWRTVVLGGLRQGGPAYYALDVTTPGATTCAAPSTSSGYPCYLWEFPREDDGASISDAFGDTWGDPVITQVKLDVNGTVVSRWVAIVTGGYHANGDPNDHAAYDPTETNGRSIWILDLKTGRPIAVRQFDTSGTCGAAYDPVNPERSMCYAMPASPAVYDLDNDDHADVIVAVDLGGQAWKWVIHGTGWDPINTTHTIAENDTAWPFRKFFEAPVYNDGTNNYYKSFYFAPNATFKGTTLWLAFGSGERNDLLHTGDATTTDDNNRFYALKDGDPLDTNGSTTVITESDLLDVSSTSTCSDITAYDGYFFIGAEGEKWVTNTELFAYYVIVNSYIPVPSSDPCEIGGEAFLYIFRIYCGEGAFTSAGGTPSRSQSLGVGLPTDPRVSVGSDGEPDLIISKQGGEIVNQENILPAQSPGMFYWRELTD